MCSNLCRVFRNGRQTFAQFNKPNSRQKRKSARLQRLERGTSACLPCSGYLGHRIPELRFKSAKVWHGSLECTPLDLLSLASLHYFVTLAATCVNDQCPLNMARERERHAGQIPSGLYLLSVHPACTLTLLPTTISPSKLFAGLKHQLLSERTMQSPQILETEHQTAART